MHQIIQVLGYYIGLIHDIDIKTVIIIFCITYILGLKGINRNFEREHWLKYHKPKKGRDGKKWAYVKKRKNRY